MRVAQRETGAALLAVLLLVAVMSALAVASLERLQLATRLAGNIAALDQARAFATAAEALAVVRINDLIAQNPEKTTLAGGWQGERRTLPLPDGGVAFAQVWDGGNCFNLNSVAEGSDPRALRTRYLGVEQFVALMAVLDIPEGDARSIGGALADWIDADTQPARAGAEDAAYGDGERPYRTANTMLAEVSELRSVAGMTPEYYEILRPWLCALPTTQLSPINVNTLIPQQAPLLAMFSPGRLSLDQAAAIIAARPATGWNSGSDFWSVPALVAVDAAPEIMQQVEIRTRWFRLDLEIVYATAELRQSALIDGGIAPGRVVARQWGGSE